MVILGPNDELAHSEMRFGDGIIMVGRDWSPLHKSPANIDGLNTQTVHVQLNEDVDAHCERARSLRTGRPAVLQRRAKVILRRYISNTAWRAITETREDAHD